MRSNGYGSFGVEGIMKYAHRVSYEIANGEIAKGMNVLHKCDNPSCVNPDHLFLGTQKENMEDCVKKKRRNAPVGERQHLSKLTKEKVLEIRELAKSITQRKISEMYNISEVAISCIILRKTWKHI